MRILRLNRFPLLMVAALLALALPSAAQASLKASASLHSSGEVTRIVVKLSSTKRLCGKRAPRSVSLKAHGSTYRPHLGDRYS